MRSAPVTAVVLTGLLALSACSGSDGGAPEDGAEPGQAVTAVPAASTLVADTDPVAAALSTSRALFASSPVAVVAGDEDPLPDDAVDAAEQLGVPLLLVGDDPAPVVDELDRLGVEQVVLADDAGTAEGALGDRDTSAVGDELPELRPTEPLSDVVVLDSGSPATVAGAVTARAAGAVVVVAGQTDPRASADVVGALADALDGVRPAAVVALGADFAGVDGLDWKTATAASGTQLPGGGQLLFPEHFLVAMYGSPEGPALGVLGEQGLDESIARADQFAAPYADLLPDRTVVPTFEVIVTVASASAGPDGNYSTEADPAALRPYVEAAGAAGLYVVLDLQPGRTDFLTQARQYESLLQLPYVGLALDPEWRLQPDEVHLQQIGSVGVDEVNQVVTWLADLTRENALPQKLLVLHQFRASMVTDRERLDTSRDELAVMVHVDGQGSQPAKQGTWNALHQGAPSPLYWGWKNFIDEDEPMLTPAETVAQAQPLPELVTYQ